MRSLRTHRFFTTAAESMVCFCFAAILGVHTLVTSSQTYDGTASKEGYNSKYNHMIELIQSSLKDQYVDLCLCVFPRCDQRREDEPGV